ncbi:hypothetical protein [Poseidonibacter lekithochrous]|uniref:hypothetical protein n=1 Tax=Poseidonibacter lekithochrous TaxID=1904463 RepID=UPI000D37CBAF|nr:hypothetical protein [Poseidonibacter lekithochrous]
MIKFILLLSFIILNLNASTINFQEEKYIEVIDNTVLKKGSLDFKENQITLKYKNSNRVLIYKEDDLTIKNDEDTQTIDLNKQIALKMIFLLIEAIHTNDLQTLQEHFKIHKNNKLITLEPKSSLQSYIENVEFKKDKKLEFLTIKMTNGNITTIREIND